jgi:hypothetical protein
MKKEVFDDIGRFVSGTADKVSRKTGELVEVTRLKNQVYGLEREINKDYTDLGKMIYERYVNEGTIEEALLPLCEEIAQKQILIEQYQGEMEEVRKEG